VPNLFLIAIPLFVNSWVYRIAVRLRYRKNGGKVVWFYQLYRHDLTFQKAFEEHARRPATRRSCRSISASRSRSAAMSSPWIITADARRFDLLCPSLEQVSCA
jgi:hypothetical protein